MFKKNYLIILTLCLTTLSGSLVFAEICPDVVGDWDATLNWVNYNHPECPDYFCYTQFTLIFHILQQDGCLFYGYREVPNNPQAQAPITGVISQGMSITWNASGTLYNGILGGYNPSRHIFTKIKYTVLNSYQNAGKGIATRK